MSPTKTGLIAGLVALAFFSIAFSATQARLGKFVQVPREDFKIICRAAQEIKELNPSLAHQSRQIHRPH
jgi:hypothetical protein